MTYGFYLGMTIRFGQKMYEETAPTMLTNGGGSDNALFILGVNDDIRIRPSKLQSREECTIQLYNIRK